MTNPVQTIALVDDEEGFLKLLQTLVVDLGYECVGVGKNGTEAIELVRRCKPNVLLMDFHMPVMDGFEALRQIVALGTTAVVMLTADPDPELGRKAMDSGGCGYM